MHMTLEFNQLYGKYDFGLLNAVDNATILFDDVDILDTAANEPSNQNPTYLRCFDSCASEKESGL